MNSIINGKQALIALANGEEVQWATGNDFQDITDEWQVREFLHPSFKFRLKPKMISINGIEVPAPFKPKVGDCVWSISDDPSWGYCSYNWLEGYSVVIGVWRTEQEVKQVVEALRQVFAKKVEEVGFEECVDE
ncbi:hypothetical protein SAMN05421749_103278 [Acinetobacter marinus]|uniref:Uncharacterized protein n=1 Tax=Acinetobacter marinus TaxID=281375 RepID=A0A1G6J990_9GAMM|nr:hypothetical protein [Acinetobacter marinus]SDC15173.1 hypothetical protein SAMN05421749_103278 [Acinetobacter marinus]